jgi:hypothetical protein
MAACCCLLQAFFGPASAHSLKTGVASPPTHPPTWLLSPALTRHAGLFVLSLSSVARGHDLLGALCFAVLLCAKHIFLYAAPAFFVHLLVHYCRSEEAPCRRGLHWLTAALAAWLAS